jgi:hypothetical protein
MEVLPEVLGIQVVINEFIQYITQLGNIDPCETSLSYEDHLEWALL